MSKNRDQIAGVRLRKLEKEMAENANPPPVEPGTGDTQAPMVVQRDRAIRSLVELQKANVRLTAERDDLLLRLSPEDREEWRHGR